MEGLVRRLAEAGVTLPTEDLRAAQADWEAAAPALLALLEDVAAGRDRSEAAMGALFFAFFLFGAMRESRAFQPLCRLARDAAALEEALGDGVTEDLPGILAATFDGDLDTLTGLMLARETDGFIRNAGFGALTLLVAEGRIERAGAEAALHTISRRMAEEDDREEWAWIGFCDAVARLAIEALVPQAEEAFRRRLIGRMLMRREDFLKELAAGRAATTPEALRALLAENHLALPGDPVARLSTWHAFTPAGQREREAALREQSLARLAGAMEGRPVAETGFHLPMPAANPHRGVGRNDPCPCGSGRKFKKCCLAA